MKGGFPMAWYWIVLIVVVVCFFGLLKLKISKSWNKKK